MLQFSAPQPGCLSLRYKFLKKINNLIVMMRKGGFRLRRAPLTLAFSLREQESVRVPIHPPAMNEAWREFFIRLNHHIKI